MYSLKTLRLQTTTSRFQWLTCLPVVFLICGMLALSGCGQNPPLNGNPAVKQPAVNPVAQADGELIAVAPGVVADDVQGHADVEVVQRDDGRPSAKTGLVRGLAQVLSSTPLDDDQKDSIRDQMDQADDILHNAKQQNQEALRQAFRQQRLRGPGSPNIIMIVADDLCLSDLNCYGASEILTPNIDRLAQAGTRFTQAYAGSPESRDARWCLVAGRRPDQATTRNQGAAALQSDDITVAEVMWQAGYTTAVFGHWGVMSASGAAEPEGHGYDAWLGTYGLPDEPQPYPEFVIQSGSKLRLTKNSDGQQGQFVQDFFVAEATDFLSRNVARSPVFLQFFFSVPGVRRTVPKLENYTEKQWSDVTKIRAAAITQMDRDIGKLIQRLTDIKQLSNTVFIITSDTAGNPTSETTTANVVPQTFRGQQGELYEGGLRVPLILSGIPGIARGATSEVVTAAWDLPATLFQLAQVAKRPQRKQGQSLLPHLVLNAPQPERFLTWEQKQGTAKMAVRWKDWKAIQSMGDQWELYDLKSDPLEADNIATEHPDIVAEIQKKLSPVGRNIAGTSNPN